MHTALVVVFVMGCLVGLAELLTSFEAPFGTPRNKWPWILMVVNGLTGMGVFWLLVQVRGMPEKPILTAVAVGLGFHALIRTKLVLAKSFFPGSSPDWGLDVGWLYTRLQDFVKKRLDQALMRGRKQSIDRLIRFYTLDGLYTEVKTAIQLRETFSEEEKETERRKVDEFMNDQSLSNDLLKIYLRGEHNYQRYWLTRLEIVYISFEGLLSKEVTLCSSPHPQTTSPSCASSSGSIKRPVLSLSVEVALTPMLRKALSSFLQ